MPTYEYQCEDCGSVFDHFQSISSEPLNRCKVCNTGHVVRKIGTGAGLIFKGSGFYLTDYKNKSNSEAKSSSGGAAKETSAKPSPADPSAK